MLNIIEDKFMVNQINDSINMKPIDSENRLKAKQPETKEVAHESVAPNQVSLSSTSKQLDSLKESLKDEPEVNAARVLYFRAEIESGNYQIDSGKIAKSMLNLEIA